MKQYKELLSTIMSEGIDQEDRTGVGTRSIFGYQMKFNMDDGFPLITTKKIHIPSVIHELLWFISGSTNIKYLQENGVRIWNEWANDNGDLGPVYGKQWRDWKGIDQLEEVIEQIKLNPNSRRLIVSAWNVEDLDSMALPPCHCFYQFSVRGGKSLDLQLYQRSADVFLGVPFNIASYSLLLHMVAGVTGLKPGTFTHSLGDAHIYTNHIEQVEEQLSREERPLPKLVLTPRTSIDDYTYDDIKFADYNPHPHIKGAVAV